MRFPYHGAGILLAVKDKNTFRVLLGKRTKKLFHGKYCIPGGFCEKGETEYQTARRETREEAGFDIEEIKATALGSWSLRLPFFSWKTFFFVAENEPLLSMDEFSDLGFFEIKKVKDLRTRPFTLSEVEKLKKLISD